MGCGIVVDDTLQTSREGVFPIGECAEHRGQIYGLLAPGLEQCGVLANRLCEGVVAVGSCVEQGRLQSAVQKARWILPWQRARFRKRGYLWSRKGLLIGLFRLIPYTTPH